MAVARLRVLAAVAMLALRLRQALPQGQEWVTSPCFRS